MKAVLIKIASVLSQILTPSGDVIQLGRDDKFYFSGT
jgi:hypothetical protein